MTGEEPTAASPEGGRQGQGAGAMQGDPGADGRPAQGPLDLGGLRNLRDLGGLPTVDGRKTLPGVLYRSEAPRRGDARPPETFQWPPPTVIDLRSAVERGSHPHPLSELGSTVHVMPLLGEEVGKGRASIPPSVLAEGLGALYLAMLDYAAPRLVEILDIVAEEPGPVLVHCSVGKDRTGVVVALLLRLAGVEPSHVLADYAATAENLRSVLGRLKGRSVLPTPRPVEEGGPDLTAVMPEAAERVLSVVDGHPEGPAGWLLERGAREASITAWRNRFVG